MVCSGHQSRYNGQVGGRINNLSICALIMLARKAGLTMGLQTKKRAAWSGGFGGVSIPDPTFVLAELGRKSRKRQWTFVPQDAEE